MPAFTVRQPRPQNQFWKLRFDTSNGVYVKDVRWGTNFDAANCMAGGGAITLDAHTGGSIITTPPRIRSLQFDQSGGIGVDDVDLAWHRGWNQDLLRPDFINYDDALHFLRVEKRCVLLGVDYRLVPEAEQLQQPGNFDHAIVLSDWAEGGTDDWVYRFDTLGTSGKWVRASAYRAAAGNLAVRNGRTKERLFVGFSAKRPHLTQGAPKYSAKVTSATSLWNEQTHRWVYNGSNALKAGTMLVVRGAQYKKDGVACYPVVGPTPYVPAYYVPVKNVTMVTRL